MRNCRTTNQDLPKRQWKTAERHASARTRSRVRAILVGARAVRPAARLVPDAAGWSGRFNPQKRTRCDDHRNSPFPSRTRAVARCPSLLPHAFGGLVRSTTGGAGTRGNVVCSGCSRHRAGCARSGPELGDRCLNLGDGGGGSPELVLGGGMVAVFSSPVVVPVVVED